MGLVLEMTPTADPGPGFVLAKLAPRCVPDAQIVAFDDDDVPLMRAA